MSRRAPSRVPSWVPPVCLSVGVIGALVLGLWTAYQVLTWLCTLLVWALVGVVLLGVMGADDGTGRPEPAGPYVTGPSSPPHPRTT